MRDKDCRMIAGDYGGPSGHRMFVGAASPGRCPGLRDGAPSALGHGEFISDVDCRPSDFSPFQRDGECAGHP